jgi:Domain of unknown function (DUF4375)
VDAFEVVEPVFQEIFSRVWRGREEHLEVLSALPNERAIYTTRILEGELDNGGWYQVFGNGVDHLIQPAIEGYELLGQAGYASHLRDVVVSGFGDESPETLGEALDAAYFELAGSEEARADLIRINGIT